MKDEKRTRKDYPILFNRRSLRPLPREDGLFDDYAEILGQTPGREDGLPDDYAEILGQRPPEEYKVNKNYGK